MLISVIEFIIDLFPGRKSNEKVLFSNFPIICNSDGVNLRFKSIFFLQEKQR